MSVWTRIDRVLDPIYLGQIFGRQVIHSRVSSDFCRRRHDFLGRGGGRGVKAWGIGGKGKEKRLGAGTTKRREIICLITSFTTFAMTVPLVPDLDV